MKYRGESCSVELSVRELCERVYLSGDIGRRYRSSFDACALGAEIHREIQENGGELYSPEISLSNTCVYDGIYYTVCGRADGVIKKDGGFTVDEIKSVRGIDFLAPPREIFVAQMKCYAYFLAFREELERVGGRITYVNAEDKKIKYFNYEYDIGELREWYMGLISRISCVGAYLKDREENVLPSAEGAAFPYGELREGQEIMIR